VPRITTATDTGTAAPTEVLPESILFDKDGVLTTEGAFVASFLATTDFGGVFESMADAADETVIVVAESEDGSIDEIDLDDAALSVLAAIDEAGTYKAMSRSAVLSRMKNARTQTADERLKNKKAAMWRRRNAGKLRLNAAKRDARVGAKAALASKRRGVAEDAVEFTSITAGDDIAEAVLGAIKTIGLIDEAALGGYDKDGNITITVSDDIAEAIEAWMDGAAIVIGEEVGSEVLSETADEGVDLADLTEMFFDDLDEMAESESLTDRATAAAFGHYFAGQGLVPLEEAGLKPGQAFAGTWKKGDFKKVHKGTVKSPKGKSGPELVNRMLGAMIYKGAIKRVKAGSGYTGGDYGKASGYGPGTDSGIKAWLKAAGHSADGSDVGGNPKKIGVKMVVQKNAKIVKGMKAKAAVKSAAKAAAKKADSGKKVAAVKGKEALLAKIRAKAGGKKKKVATKVESDAAPAAPLTEGHYGASLTAGMLKATGATPAARGVSESTVGNGASMAAAIIRRTGARPVYESVAPLAESNEALKKIGVPFVRVGEGDFGVMYTPSLTEGELRAKAKAAGFERITTAKMGHTGLTEAHLVFLRDRMLVAPK